MSIRGHRVGAVERPDRREPGRRPAGRGPRRAAWKSSIPAGHRLLGGARRRQSARDYRELLDGAPELQALIARCLDDRTRRCGPAGIRADRGAVTHLVGHGVAARRRPTASQGAICLFSDLTQVIELEEQLRLKEALARWASSPPASPTSSATGWRRFMATAA